MKKITFITGGIKSGKSNKAVKEADRKNSKVAFIATAKAFDDEMSDRIKKHKESRPQDWDLFEEPLDIAEVTEKITGRYDTVIIDCIGLWITNMMLSELSDEDIVKKADNLTKTFAKIDYHLIIVSNESGLGLVPTNKMGRKFCDLLGITNQIIAKAATESYFMASGIPLKLK